MVELKKDETNRNLGKQPHTCRICGAEGIFDTYLVREMMQGTKEEFPYFVCDRCRCLQITDVPENLGDYYGSGYYSFQMPEASDMEFVTPVFNMKKILDVGCGSGAWLVQKAMEGWGNLYGCDPFLDKDRHYGKRVTIRNCSIHEMPGEGTFDIIHMNDSFEHMTDPLEVLKSAGRLLAPRGILYMDIPTYPNIAFEQFGAHWYQLDAPRHIFLHSRESLAWLADASGMEIFDIKYNSNEGQFIRSYFYQHDIPFWEQEKLIQQYFGPKEFEKLRKEALAWNEKEYGDHMEVYWQRKDIGATGNGKKVIFQRFSGKEKRDFPYPPVYKEQDTDYICFTDSDKVYSSFWKVQLVEDLEREEELKAYLEEYDIRREVRTNQIQMGPLWEEEADENLITVPALEELPEVKLDLTDFVPTADENGDYIYRKNLSYSKGKYKGRPLLLTIGVPVSNQIDTIERCLSHVKPLLDGLDSELLVIDTGSTDGTVEVCKRYGAKIISHPWCDNMSKVRNEGIYHAKGLWYLSIDDDEWFEDVEDILLFFKSGNYKKYNAACYIQRNYMDSEGRVFEDHSTQRMAEITPGLHFEGRIHDALAVQGRVLSCMLGSYAHHYGFVHDKPEKMKKKFLRNTSILIRDVYEYPNDLRYLFQLANEYRIVNYKDTAIGLFAQVIALSKELDDVYRRRNSVVVLFTGLYDMNDPRLFAWASCWRNLDILTVVEKACIAWCQESLAFQMGKPAGEVLLYYTLYEKLLVQYRLDSDAGKHLVFQGLAMVEHELFIMDAKAIALCSYLEIGEEEKALQLLEEVSLEVLQNRRIAIFAAGFAADDVVYDALCAKLTVVQWEEWSGIILDAFTAGMAKDEVFERQKKRFSDLLSKISVSAIISWVEHSAGKRSGKLGEWLREYALMCTERHDDVRGGIVQELCLCAWLLKEAYVQVRGKEQEDKKDGGNTFCVVMEGAEIKEWKGSDSREILYQYITVLGAFAEKYYNPECLIDAESHVIPPDILAAYRMAVVLADGTASSENVAILKQALEIFPPFHEEVRSILMRLT